MSSSNPSGAKKPGFKLILIAAGICLGLGLVLTFTQMSNKPRKDSSSSVPEKVDFDGTLARANAGDAGARERLGMFYAKGLGTNQDYSEAAKWYRLAADQGNAAAQVSLGELYEAGQGVKADDTEAARLYRTAAEQGFAKGQYSLAILYLMGKGVPRDVAEAVKWYEKAAEQGNELAQYNLGMRYKDGDGVVADPVKAYKWLSLAAEKDLEDAIQARDQVKRSLTKAQLTEAKKQIEEFSQKNAK